ncbi:PH domain-containing protein [Metabacillus sp. RGM 3146]|uniref:PH domain-containing protein n=1 Tax=Metabacillus sp. RGM 3146 TaxID=3401092 RepID=UPI003B9D9439
MREAPENRISGKALTMWRISALLSSLFYLFVLIGVSVLFYFKEWPIWIVIALFCSWIIHLIYSAWLKPMLRHRVWRYEIHEQEIDLQYGMFTVRRVLIPMVRVQHVDTQQGPLLRKYQLATIEITTAATKHHIPALDVHEADQLRDYISRLARVTDDDE